ncbi:purine-nucleoside phosphorylase [Roseibium hamelinense]|uniref:Purine nucleoside phosphorylase n=1 Tax=Roseibium hamelinense TaxID=150831 RepID=A0A562SJ01_9HYPH|nr:purine-nucleoside phosphorylase [Roseibium hamelinense]MTI43939.1 purine-nucleoside phosphorylase [Roseibium hamelinense]TWI80766.1 purine-nucleoside phosphorylase [Roseibium hamelinense]
MSGFGRECAEIVRAARPGSYRVGMILGSGLGSMADEVEDAVRIPYGHLAEFPVSTVTSHSSELVAGTMSGVPVVILSGRAHYYESGNAQVMRTPVETLKELGCNILLATNAAGSLREDVAPGSPMLISDHINWSGLNPLIGEEDERRFLDLSAAYDADLRAAMHKVAETTGQGISEGTYMWFSGPTFETPAEIKMAKMLGADAVGMSTVPEVIIGRFLGMRVAAMSVITNFGAGLQAHGLSHDETKSMAQVGMDRMKELVRGFVQEVGHE